MLPDWTIQPAKENEREIILNLARFYAYDMSEHAGFEFPDSGQFEAGPFMLNYFGIEPVEAPYRWPADWQGFAWLIRVGGHPAGFALVRRVDAGVYDMGEFFIVRKYRRTGLGKAAATAMFGAYRGRWQVRELLTNKGAQAFWRKIIGDFTGGNFTEAQEHFGALYSNREFIVQRFDSRD